MPNLSHIDDSGAARMVDVSAKQPTLRQAAAEGFVIMQPQTLQILAAGNAPKGEVLNTARIAGIMAAKKTGELIPLCHPLGLDQATVDFQIVEPDRVRITATATITAKTGIEMEAFTAVAIAALTIIDMLKAVDRTMRVDGIRLVSKTGGKSDYHAAPR
jgi:cyclic pyranopterin phosphate synthase